MIYVYGILLYIFMIRLRDSREYIITVVLAFVLGNLLHLDEIVPMFSSDLLHVSVYELLLLCVCFVFVIFVKSIGQLRNNTLLTIVEIGSSIGLCYLFQVGFDLIMKI